MKQQSKLTAKQEQTVEPQLQAKAGHEFQNSDELLRFDAEQTVVPPEIAARLERSVQKIAPKKSSGWFARIFGGNNL